MRCQVGEDCRVLMPEGPRCNHSLGELGHEYFALVVGSPTGIGIGVSECGDDDDSVLGEYRAHIVANVVERAGFVGDGRDPFRRIDAFQITGNAIAVELNFEHVERGSAERLIGGDCRSRACNGGWRPKVAGREAFHQPGHLARRCLAQSEFLLIGRHGTLGGLRDLLVEPGVFHAEGDEAVVHVLEGFLPIRTALSECAGT